MPGFLHSTTKLVADLPLWIESCLRCLRNRNPLVASRSNTSQIPAKNRRESRDFQALPTSARALR